MEGGGSFVYRLPKGTTMSAYIPNQISECKDLLSNNPYIEQIQVLQAMKNAFNVGGYIFFGGSIVFNILM